MDEEMRQGIIVSLGCLDGSDPESSHDQADGLLMFALEKLGEKGIVYAYLRARDRVGFWYA